MGCPYWREVLMVFCAASPVRKPIPADRVVPEGPCSCGDFEHCPVFQMAMSTLAQLQRPPDKDAGKEEP